MVAVVATAVGALATPPMAVGVMRLFERSGLRSTHADWRIDGQGQKDAATAGSAAVLFMTSRKRPVFKGSYRVFAALR